MFFFILAGLLSIFFAFVSQFKGKQKLIFVSLFIIFYIVAFQDAIGCDIPSYHEFFDSIMRGEARGVLFRTTNNRESLEIGWYYLNLALGKLFHSFNAVMVVASLLYSFTLYQLLRRIHNQWHWVAIAYFYFQTMLFFMSGLRQSVALCLFVLALLQLNNKRYYIALILLAIGFTFHNSIMYGLFFILIYFLFASKWLEKRKTLFSLILSALFIIGLVSLYSIQTYVSSTVVEVMDTYTDMYTGYAEELGEGASFSLLNTLSRVFVFILSILAFRNCDYNNRWILGLSIFAQLGSLIFGNIGTVGRVMLYASIFTVPAYAMIPLYVKNNVLKKVFSVFVIFIALRTFLSSLTNIQFVGYLDYHTIFNLF